MKTILCLSQLPEHFVIVTLIFLQTYLIFNLMLETGFSN